MIVGRETPAEARDRFRAQREQRHGLYACKFCGDGFVHESDRDAHQWTCKPWEKSA